MKKVLTLVSALSMVAGSAFAHDYNWGFENASLQIGKDNLKDLSKTGSVSVTKDGLKFAEGEGNYVKFTAQTQDVVTVKAKGSTGEFYVKVAGSLYSAKISEHTSLEVTIPSEGEVQVWASNGVTITAIAAESQAYRDVKLAIDETREILNRRVNDIAPYVKLSKSDFYLGVKKLYNDQGEKLEELVADLNARVTANTVSNEGGKDALIAALAEIQKEIGTKGQDASTNEEKGFILVNAQAAKAKYDAIMDASETKVSAAASEIAKRKAKDGSAESIYNKVVVNRVTTYPEKWTGIEATYKNYVEKKFNDLKAAAIDALGKYPDTSDLNAYPSKFDVIKTYSDNVFNRYDFENKKSIVTGQSDTNLAFIGNLGSVASGLMELSSVNSTLFDNSGLADDKATAEALSEKIKKSDNKHKISDLNGEFATPAKNLNTVFDNKKLVWGSKAQADLQATIKKLQAKLDDYSYKVTSQYQNDVQKLREYQAQFAKLQNQIDGVTTSIKDVSTAAKAYAVAKGWKANNEILTGVDNELSTLWGNTQIAENNAIIQKNNDAVTELETKVNAARANYQAAVAEIDKYRKADFFQSLKTVSDPNKDAVAKFAEDIKTLYDYSLALEKALRDAKEARDKNNTDVVGGEPTAKLVDFTGYDNIIVTNAKNISDALAASKQEANDIALAYYDGEDGAYDKAVEYVTIQKTATNSYASDNKISDDIAVKTDAANRFRVIFNGTTKNGKLVDANNTLANASAKCDELYTDLKLALDVIGDKTVDGILNNSKVAADAILADVKKYNGMKKEIAKYQVEWSVAKAAADKNNIPLQDKLEEFHKALDAAQTGLENTDKLVADQAKYDKMYKSFDDYLYIVNNFDKYQANVAAEKAIDTALTTAKADLATAKVELGNLTKNAAKEILNTAITNANNVIAAVEAEYAVAKEAKTTSEKKDELVKRLKNINLAASIKEAQDKDKVVEGDLNGDGVVNVSDLEVAKKMVATSAMEDDEYTIFLSTYRKVKNN